MKIFDERISNDVDTVEYRIKIKQFRERMEKWKPGRKLTNLSPFYFMNSKFELQICPNGKNDDNKDFVSIFLMNENNEDLYVSYSMSLGHQTQSLENQKILSHQGFGWPKFYCHGLGLRQPIEEEYDDKLEIICEITKLMRDPAEGGQFENQYQLTSEIRSYVRDLTDSHLREEGRLLALETDMKSRFNDMMQGQKAMQMEFQKKIDEVTKSMQEMKDVQINQQQQQPSRFDDTGNDIHYNNIPKPKCVKCRSNLTSTSQIFQCPSGHLLCLICKDISGETKCPVCHEAISRATGLEGYLKILFPTTANFEFLSKDKLPQNISNVE